MSEQYKDTIVTTLNGAINNATTTVVVTDGSSFSAVGDFHAKVDSEIMRVTARVTNTLTVARGQEGTTAVSHNDLATITQILTAESLQRLGSQIHLDGSWASRPTAAYANEGILHFPTDTETIARSNGSTWNPFGPIYQFTPPDNSTFSWDNQDSAAIDATRDSITLIAPGQGSGNMNYRVRYKTAPATPYLVTVYLQTNLFIGFQFLKIGILFRQNSNSSFEIYEFLGGTNQFQIRMNRMATPTSNAGGGQKLITSNFLSLPNWFRIGDTGANRIFEISYDGIHWFRPYNTAAVTGFPIGLFPDVPRTDFLTADQVGFAVDAAWNDASNSHGDIYATILHWSETGQTTQLLSLKAKIS